MNDLLGKVKEKAEEYRPLPFWSWNDKLEDALSKWQINEMAKTGHGGYFMHARGGNEIDYLGEEWFHHIQVGIEEGIKTGLHPWVYDESGWPSGFAGGDVTAKGEKYHAKGLKLEKLQSTKEYEKGNYFLGFYSINEKSGEIKLIEEEKVLVGEILVAISYTVCPYYIDILNHEVVKAFIECTHEKYYERFKEHFGKGLQGFFTDEPRISEGDIPWSTILPVEFKKRYGYDLIEKLPALFMTCKGYEKVRYDFWSMINELFVSAFMKQIYEWCDNHDCMLTGHVMMEESIYSQMTGTSGSMPFYEYMHIPGVDWLRRTIGNSIMSKQVASVAQQLGKTKVLTESYALCGWDVSLEELKWIAEWQFVNGVNLMCQHLEGYTLRGLRKRDYPPSLFFQQAWWEEYKDFNDYLSRLGAALTEGKPLIETLVIHPMKTGWITYDGKNNEQIKQVDEMLITLTDKLMEAHIDYHLGDETLIRKYASVQNDRFVIGECMYQTVILPNLISIDQMTLELLEKFIKQDGKVFYLGNYPVLCEGMESERLLQLKKDILPIEQFEGFINLIKSAQLHSVWVTEEKKEVKSIRYCQRELEQGKLLYLLNLDKENTYETCIRLKGNYKVSQLVLETMAYTPYEATYEEGSTILSLKFAPMQSYLFTLTEDEMKQEVLKEKKVIVKVPTGKWRVENMDYNALTLDKCRYQVDKGEWEEAIPIIHLMDKLLKLKRRCHIEQEFNFEIETDMGQIGRVYLVAEQPEKFKIWVNGKPVNYIDNGWWKDTSFKKINIRDYLQAGHNTIRMATEFYQRDKVYRVLFGENVYETELNQLTYDTELESIYLIGEFGVLSKSSYETLPRYGVRTQGEFVLTKAPCQFEKNDFTKEGLCFFSGKLALSKKLDIKKERGEKVVLQFERIRAAMIKVYLNDSFVGKLMWEPFELEVTDLIQEGENLLKVEVYSSNRNLLGPHHHMDGEIYNVGPKSFTGEWSWCEKPTEGVETKDEDRTKSYWSDDYCLVEFGL